MEPNLIDALRVVLKAAGCKTGDEVPDNAHGDKIIALNGQVRCLRELESLGVKTALCEATATELPDESGRNPFLIVLKAAGCQVGAEVSDNFHGYSYVGLDGKTRRASDLGFLDYRENSKLIAEILVEALTPPIS